MSGQTVPLSVEELRDTYGVLFAGMCTYSDDLMEYLYNFRICH